MNSPICRGTDLGVARSLLAGLCAAAALSTTALAQPPPPPSFPVTLQQAVVYATDSYPAIRGAAARVLAQESTVDLAGTAFLPRLDSSLQFNRATRNNIPGLLLPGTIIPGISGPVSDTSAASTIWGSAAGVLVSWEAFDFGARGAAVDVARSLLARATAGADLTRLEVGVKTADAFLRLAAAQETVRAAQANLERQQVFASSVAVLVKNELRPGADDSRAQAELALARIQVIQAEQAEQIARAALAQWLGVAPADVQIASGPLLAALPPSPSGPKADAHPLAASQMANVETSRAVQRVVARSFAPRVYLQTAFSARGTGATAAGTNMGGWSGLAFDTPNWALAVTVTMPLFEWFSLRERGRIAAQNERAEAAAYDRIVQELSTQIAQAQAEMDGARRVAENTPIQLSSARVLEQQSRARYDAGLAAILEVAESQRLLLQAEVGDAVARLAVWRALLADAVATGDLSGLVK